MKAHLKTIGTILIIIILFLSFGKIFQMYDSRVHFFFSCLFGTALFLVILMLLAWVFIIYTEIYEHFNKD